MTLEELKVRYISYREIISERIKEDRYYKGFAYGVGILEQVQEETEAVLRLIEEKEKTLN